jgi:hypothetical protein
MLANRIPSHSAEVEMWLDCGIHGCVPLNRVSPSAVVAKSPVDVPAGDVDLVVSVDGQVHRVRVHLANGFSRTNPTATILAVDHVAPF